MKRIICIIVVVLALGLVAACGSNDGASQDQAVLDFRSMMDTETGTMISLGDTRESIETALGRPVNHDEEWDEYTYHNGIAVIFENNRAISISAYQPITEGRFEIFGYRVGMTRDEVSDVFDLSFHLEGIGTYSFVRSYDRSGNLTDDNNAYILSGIIWNDASASMTVYLELPMS